MPNPHTFELYLNRLIEYSREYIGLVSRTLGVAVEPVGTNIYHLQYTLTECPLIHNIWVDVGGTKIRGTLGVYLDSRYRAITILSTRVNGEAFGVAVDDGEPLIRCRSKSTFNGIIVPRRKKYFLQKVDQIETKITFSFSWLCFYYFH